MSRRAIDRLRAEFLEMPGLRLTSAQIQRLSGMEPDICGSALTSLLEEGFLCAKPDGTFARLTDRDVSRPGQAKAAAQSPHLRRRAS